MSDTFSKTYRPWNPAHYRQLNHCPLSKLPEGDLVFFLLDTVPLLDLRRFYAPYENERRGAPPFDPAMMVCLLLYAYCVGVYSSRKIATACERNLAFLAIDGTKLAGNASRHKAMSYGYMTKEVERLRAEIDALLQQAQEQDTADAAALGSRRGDELPDELKRREDRLATIRSAQQRLEEQARAEAEAERQRRQEAEAERQRTGQKRQGASGAVGAGGAGQLGASGHRAAARRHGPGGADSEPDGQWLLQ